jgi:type I restriction enzyme R subunit
MSHFTFLQAEWPSVFEAATKAESLAHVDARASCFYARRGLELAVKWLYKHDPALTLPYQENLSALIHEPTFRKAAGTTIFNKAQVLVTQGNLAVHSHKLVLQYDAQRAVGELFHIAYWLAHNPRPGSRSTPASCPRRLRCRPRRWSSSSVSKRSCASGTRSSRNSWPTRPHSTRS